MFSLKHAVIVATVSMVLTGANSARAGFVSGWDLLQICKTNPQQGGYGIYTAQCRGYVTGVADTFSCSESLHGFHWNNSDNLEPDDLVKIVTAWFTAHPKTLRHEADGLVAAALSETYPCK